MDRYLFAGLFDLPWWGYALVALALTHVTIVAVTLYLHRCQTHHALDLHPLVAHFFRLWLWLTTGMRTREWVAVHRKHHAKSDAAGDPHSPRVFGIHRVLWGGVLLYVKASMDAAIVERYGRGTPDDWIERALYSRYVLFGLTLTGVADVVLFGITPGVLIFLTQIAWIPFWAAGVVNGVGHYSGYRNWPTPDRSTNIVPWAVLIGGEELHNNHHAYPTSARFSMRWFEFDLGWVYIRLLSALKLARVRHLPPTPRFREAAEVPDLDTLLAIARHRYDVLAHYDLALGNTSVPDAQRTMQRMRGELVRLWERSMATREQLVAQLQDWCRRAESSGVAPLVAVSLRIRSYR